MSLQSRSVVGNEGRESKRLSANLCYRPQIRVKSVRKFALCTTDLETLAQQNDTADLKAELAQQAERVNNAMVQVGQITGKFAEIESQLRVFRQWVEQQLLTQDDGGTGSYKSMTYVMNQIDALDKQLQELGIKVKRNAVVVAIARQQAKPQESIFGDVRDKTF
jgi:K+/H+ antiporter YhaU regulatory subunit KhtT